MSQFTDQFPPAPDQSTSTEIRKRATLYVNDKHSKDQYPYALILQSGAPSSPTRKGAKGRLTLGEAKITI
jgi:hypothetical protein